MIFSERKTVTLLNGLVLHNKDGDFPPLQEVAKVNHACDVCPVRPLCQDHNEFKCQVYGMFSGFWVGIDEALEFLETHKVQG